MTTEVYHFARSVHTPWFKCLHFVPQFVPTNIRQPKFLQLKISLPSLQNEEYFKVSSVAALGSSSKIQVMFILPLILMQYYVNILQYGVNCKVHSRYQYPSHDVMGQKKEKRKKEKGDSLKYIKAYMA